MQSEATQPARQDMKAWVTEVARWVWQQKAVLAFLGAFGMMGRLFYIPTAKERLAWLFHWTVLWALIVSVSHNTAIAETQRRLRHLSVKTVFLTVAAAILGHVLAVGFVDLSRYLGERYRNLLIASNTAWANSGMSSS